MNLLSRELKFIPTPVTNETHIRTQLLNDFKAFARGMRLQYISYGQDKEPHSFHVKSNWEPPVEQSVTFESYLEEVKTELAEVKICMSLNIIIWTVFATYILLDGLSYNTRGYFASCVVFFRAPQGRGKMRAMSKMSASIIC